MLLVLELRQLLLEREDLLVGLFQGARLLLLLVLSLDLLPLDLKERPKDMWNKMEQDGDP